MNVVRLRVDVDGDLLGAFDADGIVVATATGSTAYALSAGGPPVDPRVRAVVVVPLAAHAVISRPVVIPELLDVRVTVERGRVFVAADGRSVAWLADGESVVIRPGPELEVVRFSDSPSFQSRLRQKFRYGIPHKDLLLEPVDDEEPDAGTCPGRDQWPFVSCGSATWPSSRRPGSRSRMDSASSRARPARGNRCASTRCGLRSGGGSSPRRCGREPPVARVAAVFDNPNPRLRARRAELGIPDDDLITLSREVPASGRATCRVDGALVSQAVLREIGDLCVEVTAQGTSQRMLRRSWQRDVLDTYGGADLAAARTATAGAVRAWRSAVDALAAAHRAASTGAAELQRARDLIEDLGDLAIAPGEDAELQAERLRLRHAARIASSALSIAEASGGDDRSAADRLASAAAEGADLATVDPALAALIESAHEVVDRLRDLALDARRHADEITVDEMRLTAVEERLDMLTRVTRRHGSLDAALLELERATSLVASVDGEGGAIELLEVGCCDTAHRGRRCSGRPERGEVRRGAPPRTGDHRRAACARAAPCPLSGRPDPQPRCATAWTRATAHRSGAGRPGVDDVDFRLAPNRNSVPMPLDEGPSGGELGRLALALSAVVSEEDAPVLVLDEVDTGIGGETAARVGDVLARIGRSRQVDRDHPPPEIAARAGSHLTITKRDRPGGADARAAIVAGDERVREIARLMSGRTTDAALTRAAELLEEGSRRDRGTPSLRTM